MQIVLKLSSRHILYIPVIKSSVFAKQGTQKITDLKNNSVSWLIANIFSSQFSRHIWNNVTGNLFSLKLQLCHNFASETFFLCHCSIVFHAYKIF